jgi:hypothetical protein
LEVFSSAGVGEKLELIILSSLFDALPLLMEEGRTGRKEKGQGRFSPWKAGAKTRVGF